tara:strand:- start:1230 stop:1676 length:447 start_codon:yes stop_codon:yes gene_type:complete
MNLKKILFGSVLLGGLAFGGFKVYSSMACCSSTAATSGCTPSNCRGAKTKFGEAKVISELRLDLIDLKADMEKSKNPSFDSKWYDIHGIIGDSDSESLEIIVKEVQKIEKAFEEKLNHESGNFELPENKAKQITYLTERIEGLKKQLS